MEGYKKSSILRRIPIRNINQVLDKGIHVMIALIFILFFSLRLNRLVDSLLTSGSSPLASVLIALLHLHLTLFDR